jgi:hypothetical protein
LRPLIQAKFEKRGIELPQDIFASQLEHAQMLGDGARGRQ